MCVNSDVAFGCLPNNHSRAGGYVTNLNKAIEGTDMDGMAIEEIVKATWNNGAPTASFNNAAQVWSAPLPGSPRSTCTSYVPIS